MTFVTPTSRARFQLRFAPLDVVWAVIAPFGALALRDPRLLAFDETSDLLSAPYLFVGTAIVAGLVSILLFRLSDGMSRFFSVHDVLSICAAVATSVAAASIILFTFTRLDGVPRSTPLIYALLFGGGLILFRALHRVVVTEQPDLSHGARPDLLRNIIIVGADRFSATAIKFLASQSPQTARVIALIDETANLSGRSIAGVRVVGAVQDLESILDEYAVHGVAVDQVLVSSAVRLPNEANIALAEICGARDIEFQTIAEAFNLLPKNAPAAALAPTPIRVGPNAPIYFKFKRAMDIVAAGLLLILLAPVTLLVAGIVLVDVGTPLLFWQERIGRGGRRFLLYKFRTYRAPFDWRGDPIPENKRLSRIGRLLRATRLDEIPQLLNILVGDMGLIGPRPLLPKDQPRDPSIRLIARPGITGWAQVNGGNFVTPEEKDALDCWYIQHASIFVDIKIAIHTLIIVVTGERFDREAVKEALSWRNRQADVASSAGEPRA